MELGFFIFWNLNLAQKIKPEIEPEIATAPAESIPAFMGVGRSSEDLREVPATFFFVGLGKKP